MECFPAMSIEKKIPGVPVIGQYPVLPTGCEATALTMLLQWAGLQVEKEQVADALVKEPNPFEEDGVWRGGHPNRAFIGDPYDKDSFGVYHGPIAVAVDHFLPGRAHDITGCTFEELLGVIDAGKPVIVWATIEMKEPRHTKSWQDIHDSGRVINWLSPEHCMTMIGYTPEHVIINDPHTGGTESYERNLFRTRWEQLGRQGVTLT